MSRRAAELDVRYSLWGALPAVYQGDGEDSAFFGNFVASLDAVLSPAHAAIEDIDLYLDQRTCPPDFLPWLSGWLGLTVNERWPIKRRQEFAARGMEIFKLRGTVSGVRKAVELYAGVTPEIVDNGAVSSGQDPLGSLPGSAQLGLVVTVLKNSEADLEMVHRIVTAVKPIHIPLEVRSA